MKWRYESNYSIITLEGKLILDVTDQLKNEIKNVIDDHKITTLIVDLSQVDFIDSTGVGMLISLYKYLSERSGALSVVSNQPRVNKVIEITKLNLILPCLKSLDEALEQMNTSDSEE